MSRIDDASQEADFTAVRDEMTVAVTSVLKPYIQKMMAKGMSPVIVIHAVSMALVHVAASLIAGHCKARHGDKFDRAKAWAPAQAFAEAVKIALGGDE